MVSHLGVGGISPEHKIEITLTPHCVGCGDSFKLYIQYNIYGADAAKYIDKNMYSLLTWFCVL